MLQGLDVKEIKKYNDSVRAQKENASKAKAELEFNSKEVDRLCKELSLELGVSVTVDNVASIYTDAVNKINNDLAIGKDILNQIEHNERKLKDDMENNEKQQEQVRQEQVRQQQLNQANEVNNQQVAQSQFNGFQQPNIVQPNIIQPNMNLSDSDDELPAFKGINFEI